MRENVYGHQKRLRFLIAEIERHLATGSLPREAVRVLDVGCGTGVMITRPLAQLGYMVTGLDIDEASIQHARRLNANPHLPNLSFVCGSLEEQQREGPFDIVICSEVLEHQEEPSRFIGAMRDRLADEGILLLTVPNGYGLFELDSLVWRLLSRIPGCRALAGAVEVRAKWLLFRALGRRLDLRAREEENRPEYRATLNEGPPHLQHFTYRRVVRLMRVMGFRLVSSGKSSVWAGPLANLFLQDFGGLIDLNCRLAGRLPFACVSGWYFCFKKDGTTGA